jgi:GntR family transcriptional repressor for pyruvate dehydrogenase complex
MRKAGERSHDEPGAAHSIKADFDFHHAIARASGNHYYPELLAALGPMMILTPKGRRIAGRTTDPVHAEHLAILIAITDHDPQAAAAAMRLHLINSAERVRRET